MEGMGLKITPVIGRLLLDHLSMLGHKAGTSGTHTYLVQTLLTEGPHIQFFKLVTHKINLK